MTLLRGVIQKKGIFWEYFPNVRPPPLPPFGNPLFQKEEGFFLTFVGVFLGEFRLF